MDSWPQCYFAFLVFFTIVALNRIISMIYVLNFSTAGMNSSILLVVMLLSGFIMYGITKIREIHPTVVTIRILTLLSALLILTTMRSSALLAVVSGTLFLITSYSLTLEYLSRYRSKLLPGVALALGMHITLLTIMDTVSFYGTIIGKLILTGLIVIWLFFAWKLTSVAEHENYISLSSFTFYMYALVLFFAYPSIITTWKLPTTFLTWSIDITFQVKYTFIVVEMLLSIFIATYYTDFLRKKSNKIFSVIILLGSIEILYWGKITLLTLPFVIIAQLTLFANNIEYDNFEKQHTYILTGFGQLLAMLLMFFYVLAGNWAFIPTILANLTHGLASLYLLMLFMLLPINTHIKEYMHKKLFLQEVN